MLGRTLPMMVFAIALFGGASHAIAAPGKTPGGPMKLGKWIGYVQPEGSRDVIALSMDAFLVQKPEEPKQSESLYMLFKLGFGGYLSPEYESEIFEVLEFDYEQFLFTLDDPRNEMVITAYLYQKPRPNIEGQVAFRTGVTGKLYLEYQSDVPGLPPPVKPPPFVPKVGGQYEGICGDEKAVLQIETGKGLTAEAPIPTTGLHHYLITGTVGIENGECSRVNPPERPTWCVDHAFSWASYDFVSGKLFLSGTNQTEECIREGDTFTCRMQYISKKANGKLVEDTCRFRKSGDVASAYKPFRRKFHVVPTEAQKEPLPASAPPLSTELVTAARGSYYGYLHHEMLDRYQPVKFNVITSTSTENLHIENNVFASVSPVLYFGRGIGSELWAQQFDKRILYLIPSNPLVPTSPKVIIPGFTLGSQESDTFVQPTQWTRGFIAGVWYSHAFGRVGTFELVKGDALPPLPAEASVVEAIGGHFRGPEEKSNGGTDYRDTRLLVPKQPRARNKSFISFQGNQFLKAGGVNWPARRISQGAYDFYTGGIAWMTDDDAGGEQKLVSGFVDGTRGLKLFWPGDRDWAVSIFDHVWGSFPRVSP